MAEIDLTNFLDKEHENKSLKEVLALPPSALQGVTKQDAEALKSAFGIRNHRRHGQKQVLQDRPVASRDGQLRKVNWSRR